GRAEARRRGHRPDARADRESARRLCDAGNQLSDSDRRPEMAAIEKFEDHCWNDVVPEADLKLYSCYARETFVGPNPAILAIDLYNLVYRGGPGSPCDLEEKYPNSCGIYAHRAIEPTKRLFAA